MQVTRGRFKIALAAACLAIFGAVACFVISYDILVFDTVIREGIYALRTESLTRVLTVITYTANWQFISVMCMVLLVIPKTCRPFGMPLSITAIMASGSNTLAKHLFQRIRPDIALHLIEQGGYSFPSGHSTTGMLFYGMMIFLLRRQLLPDMSDAVISPNKNRTAVNLLTVLLSFWIIIIGFSRIYLGVHYPTDVIAGWSFGLFLFTLLSTVFSSRGIGKNILTGREEKP